MKQAILLVTVFFATLGGGQGQSVTGNVADTGGNPLFGATVHLVNLSDTTRRALVFSDPAGRFSLTLPDSGRYLATAQLLGFEPQSLEVGTGTLLFRLIKQATQLAEVSVRAKRDIFTLEADRIIVNVGSSALLSGGTAMDIMSKTPGMTVEMISKTISVDGKKGLQVYINNRQVHLTMDQVYKYLESIPAASIERMEVITSPSARYDAAGGAVLSIYTKRSEGGGLTGDVSVTPGYGRYGKLAASVGLSMREKKWSAYLLYTPQIRETYFSYTSFQSINQPPVVGSIAGNEFRTITTRQQGLRLGGELTLTPTTTLGSNLYFFGQREATNPVSTTQYELTGRAAPRGTIHAETNTNSTLDNVLANLNLQHSIRAINGSVSVDADYATYQDNNSTVSVYRDDATGEDNELSSYFPLDVTLSSLKADGQAKTAGGVGLEMGLKVSRAQITTQPVIGRYSPAFSSLADNLVIPFDYHEQVLAAYVGASGLYKSLSWKVGLRVENTSTQAVTNTLNSVRDYTTPFPSGSLSWKAPAGSMLSMTYNRRIIRPLFGALNPVYVFFDPFTLLLGNPQLVPQLASTVQLVYQLPSKHTITLGYIENNNRITEVIYRADPSSAVLYNTQINLNQETRLLLSYTFPVQFTPAWQMKLTVTGQKVAFSTLLAGEPVEVNQRTVVFNNTHTVKIGNAWTAEAQIMARTKAALGFMQYKPLFYMNLAMSRSLWNNHGSVKVSLSDIFYTNQVNNSGEYLNTNVRFRHAYETRQLFVTLSYHIGSDKIKSVSRRSTALETEQSRLRTE